MVEEVHGGYRDKDTGEWMGQGRIGVGDTDGGEVGQEREKKGFI